MHRLACALFVIAACTPLERPGARGVDGAPASTDGAAPEDRAAPAQGAAGSPVVAVTDRQALAHLEAHGHSFAEHLGEKRGGSLADLHGTSAWRSLVEIVEQDLAAVRRTDRRSGVGMDHAHRLFDARWLRSPDARFELAGVVNRIDRLPFSDGAGCGEVRLIYRLAYRTSAGGMPVASRLPMTVNVVAWQPGADCSEAARRWMPPGELTGEALGRWLAAPRGPLDLPWRQRLKSIEINLQSVRWPSTVHPSMAGHAEYILRVFQRRGDRLQPAPLENQPDVARLRASPALRGELVTWVRANLAAIDDGTAVLPERFLATSARSVAPRGLARLANRPFSQLLSARDLEGVELEGGSFARTPEELLRRLDTLSCSGCHQSRSLAGFHWLGADDPQLEVDALGVPFSPHLQDEIPLRARAVAALAAGGPLARPRPLPERVPGQVGRWGEHCGLEGFSDWGCAEGLRCQPVLGEKLVGACVEDEATIGDACEPGMVTQEENPHRDRVGAVERRSCAGGGVCERNGVGFPGGMCSGRCAAGGKEVVCGAIALLVDFNDCLAQRRPFGRCIQENSRPAALRRCSEAAPCRDDYVCARLPDESDGACMPPYFLFQLRVDGHPL